MCRSIYLFLLLVAWANPIFAQIQIELRPNAAMVAKNSLVVILPTISTSPQFSRAETHIQGELAKRLKANGFRVSVLEDASYRALLQTAEKELASAGINPKNQVGFKNRLRVLTYLADEICAQTSCSLIIDSRLTLRLMDVRNKFAEWDGVRRRIPYTRTAGGLREVEGTTYGLSVELLGVAPSGRIVFQGFGGATVPFEVDLVSTYTQLRANLFEDMEEIEEGVSIALQAFLARLDKN